MVVVPGMERVRQRVPVLPRAICRRLAGTGDVPLSHSSDNKASQVAAL